MTKEKKPAKKEIITVKLPEKEKKETLIDLKDFKKVVAWLEGINEMDLINVSLVTEDNGHKGFKSFKVTENHIRTQEAIGSNNVDFIKFLTSDLGE